MYCLMQFGNCQCGKRYIVFHPLKQTLSEKWSSLLKNELDFFVTEGQKVKCSFCGETIKLPIPETLDPEQDPDFEYVDWVLKDVEKTIDRLLAREQAVEKVLTPWLEKLDNDQRNEELEP